MTKNLLGRQSFRTASNTYFGPSYCSKTLYVVIINLSCLRCQEILKLWSNTFYEVKQHLLALRSRWGLNPGYCPGQSIFNS
jgi:hypothetical protein